jgi:hypothetical protein
MLPSSLVPVNQGDAFMARARSKEDPAPQQLTLDDWAQTEAVAALADALAPRIAEKLAQVERPPAAASQSPTIARLLTLDELVAELPSAKRPQTWKRWLYERTRRGEIPGCVKLGGMLFFEREPALTWLRAGATAPR